MIERLRQLPGVASMTVEERDQAQSIVVQSGRGLELMHELLRELGDASIGKVVSREPTLEDAYVELVSTA